MVKRIKRAKRATPEIYKKYVEEILCVTCPHCKTRLVGGVTRSIDRLICYECKNVIIMDWQALKGEKDGV